MRVARPVRRGGPGRRPSERSATRPGPTLTSGPNARPHSEHIDFSELANGFASCADPTALQAICDRFGPADVQGFFDRWTRVIPTPFTEADRAAGYFFELSMRQVEVSRTLVFDDPRRARGFFESLVQDNIGIGRPDQVDAVFAPHPRSPQHQGTLPHQGVLPGTEVRIDFSYKHSRIKQYLKEGRALRIETVINKAWDLNIRWTAMWVWTSPASIAFISTPMSPTWPSGVRWRGSSPRTWAIPSLRQLSSKGSVIAFDTM